MLKTLSRWLLANSVSAEQNTDQAIVDRAIDRDEDPCHALLEARLCSSSSEKCDEVHETYARILDHYRSWLAKNPDVNVKAKLAKDSWLFINSVVEAEMKLKRGAEESQSDSVR